MDLEQLIKNAPPSVKRALKEIAVERERLQYHAEMARRPAPDFLRLEGTPLENIFMGFWPLIAGTFVYETGELQEHAKENLKMFHSESERDCKEPLSEKAIEVLFAMCCGFGDAYLSISRDPSADENSRILGKMARMAQTTAGVLLSEVLVGRDRERRLHETINMLSDQGSEEER